MAARESQPAWLLQASRSESGAPVFRELARLAAPIAVSMVGYSVMTIVDTAFVGRLGAPALAGVGLGGMAAFTLLVFSMGLLRGVKVLVSQAVGAGHLREAEAHLGAGLIAALVLGGVSAALGQALALLIPAAAASPEAGALAARYLEIRILGAPFLLTYVALREASYGTGDARSPMIATLVANAVNVGADYLLIFEAGLGVAGAAWASVLAHVTEALLLFKRRHLAPELWLAGARRLAALWRVGLPTGLQFFMEVGAFAVLTVMISAMSEVEMAAHQIAIHALHLAFLPALAVSEAASVLVGHSVGAAREELVRRVARYALLLVTAYSAVCALALAGLAGQIAAWFTHDEAVRAVAPALFYAAAIFQLADGANIVARGVLRGAGDVRFPAVVGVVVAWIITPPFCWFLGFRLELGALGGWIGLSLEIFVLAAILWWRFLGGGWRGPAARLRAEIHRAGQAAVP